MSPSPRCYRHLRTGGPVARITLMKMPERTAIWADPKLPDSLQPAHSGGDAGQVGPVEYDFTNPVLGSSVLSTESPARR